MLNTGAPAEAFGSPWAPILNIPAPVDDAPPFWPKAKVLDCCGAEESPNLNAPPDEGAAPAEAEKLNALVLDCSDEPVVGAPDDPPNEKDPFALLSPNGEEAAAPAVVDDDPPKTGAGVAAEFPPPNTELAPPPPKENGVEPPAAVFVI